MKSWGALAVSAFALAAGIACGQEAAEPSEPTVELHVTREFGHKTVSRHVEAPLDGHGTALRLLRGYHEVETSVSGLVKAIDGLRSQQGLLDENGWVYMVNGVEADESPRDYELAEGDVVQWDLRDWDGSLGVRATVGGFPATFSRGIFGRRFPVVVRCEEPSGRACVTVKRTLRSAGVAPDGSRPDGRLPPTNRPRRAEILVGLWPRWRRLEWPRRIDGGPADSGIFAKFSADATSVRLFDWNGRHVRTEGAGTGLIGAMRPTEEDLLWVVTGVDEVGVRRAARALDAETLRNAYAVAVTDGGVEKLPLTPRSPSRARPPEPIETRTGEDADVTRYERTPAEEPSIKLDGGPPPSRLEVRDLRRGSGPRVEVGDMTIVNYVGYIHETGRKYDTSYDNRNPLPLVVVPGRHNFIDGFERGIVGMRAGGRRVVTIPADLAYGERGYPPDVLPNQALVFVIDLEAMP